MTHGTLPEHRPIPMLMPPVSLTPAEVDDRLPDWAAWQTTRTDACWIWTGSVQKRYGGQGGDRAIVSLNGHTRNAARAVWEAIHGPIPPSLGTRHTCDNALCVRPSHLLIGTSRANSRDAVLRGRLRPGGRPARAETPKRVRAAARTRETGAECADESCREVAVPGAPVPLCPHHLRRVYEFADDLVRARTSA